MAEDYLTSRDQVSREVYQGSTDTHEAGHLAGVLTFGLKAQYIAVGRDGSTQASGGVSYSLANADAQQIAVIVKLGVAAEERYYAELGYTEQSHPEFVRDMRTRSGAGDELWLSSVQKSNPHLVIDQEQAWADARRMVANPAFWELTNVLGREAGQRLYMETDAIMEVASPFEPVTLLEREGIRVWVPGEAQVRESWAAAGLRPGETPPAREETAEEKQVARMAEEVRQQAKASARVRGMSHQISAGPQVQAGIDNVREAADAVAPDAVNKELRYGPGGVQPPKPAFEPERSSRLAADFGKKAQPSRFDRAVPQDQPRRSDLPPAMSSAVRSGDADRVGEAADRYKEQYNLDSHYRPKGTAPESAGQSGGKSTDREPTSKPARTPDLRGAVAAAAKDSQAGGRRAGSSARTLRDRLRRLRPGARRASRG
jgi:hypothetical protein